jgi:hypothetical protein
MGGSGLLLGAGAGGLDPRRSIGVAADRQASAVISPPPQEILLGCLSFLIQARKLIVIEGECKKQKE